MVVQDYPDIYLLRHGQTVWNREGRLQGLLDSPLTDLGRQQARRQARLLAGLPECAQRISSPLGRAEATARIVFGDDAFRRDARVQEIDIGRFTGQPEAALRSAHPAIFAGWDLDWYDRAPGGEHFAGLRSRVQAFLKDLDGPAIIVTHGIALRMLRLIALGLPDAQLGQMPVLQGAVHVVRGGRHHILY